jgi:serpin B
MKLANRFFLQMLVCVLVFGCSESGSEEATSTSASGGSSTEGTEGSGTEGTEGSGTEGTEGSGTEGTEGSGTEGTEGSGTEGTEGSGTEGFTLVETSVEREIVADPKAAADWPVAEQIAAGNNLFAWEFYQASKTEAGNFLFSPYSLSIAFAMKVVQAQKTGSTLNPNEIVTTFHFPASDETLHKGMNLLDQGISAVAPEEEDSDGTDLKLNTANAFFFNQLHQDIEAGSSSDLANLLQQYYGAPSYGIDLKKITPEAAAEGVNKWYEESTNGLIDKVVGAGDFHPGFWVNTIGNAVYFKGSWFEAFSESATKDGDFTLLDGSKVVANMMHHNFAMGGVDYIQNENYQAARIPYKGGAEMVFILPDSGQFDAVQDALATEDWNTLFDDSVWAGVDVTLPRFNFSAEPDAKNALKVLGFDLGTFVKLIHVAAIDLHEKGTEAAAATAIIEFVDGGPEYPETNFTINLNRPFIFMIRHTSTGSILFMGRLMNPAE